MAVETGEESRIKSVEVLRELLELKSYQNLFTSENVCPRRRHFEQWTLKGKKVKRGGRFDDGQRNVSFNHEIYEGRRR